MLTRLCKRFLASDRLAFIASLSAAMTISGINIMLDSDVAHAVLYITLLFMSAHVFSIRIVLIVALFCFALITGGFIVEYFYESTGSIAGYIRCVVSLVTITLLTLRSKWSTDELRRNEAFMSGAQRLSRTGSIGLRFDRGRCKEIHWSEEAFRIFGYPRDVEPSLALMTARTHPDDRRHSERLLARLAEGELEIELERRLLMPDGAVRHLQVVINAIDPASKPDSREYVVALMDITATRKAEEALLDSQAQLAHVTRMTSLGELAASIAHEVNQPLAAIVASGESCLRWIERNEPNLEEAKLSVRRIIHSSQRANEIITGVRALSKKCVPQRQEQVFDTLVRDTLLLIQYELSHQHVQLQLTLEAGSARFIGDRVQLQQVIINLIMNACQAMGESATSARSLVIRTWVAGSDVSIAFEDNGPGIDDCQLASLFNPFYTTKAEGLGMGLSICRSIIECHEGKIWATSQKGQGATFIFVLPLATPTASVSSSLAVQPAPSSLPATDKTEAACSTRFDTPLVTHG
ncbi:ATP-binding protein [Pseudomonas fluorescens]|uniref:sensor histidine kinase n=1 Tax=Pseudomonas fluorescens TaxID=294 RepID=UPI0035238ED7